MKLYRVERTDGAGYDEYDAVIVRAASEDAALAFVCDPRPDAPTWATPTSRYSGFKSDRSNAGVCRVLVDGESGEILASFNAG
ncbi:hypothetical protein [Kitasatospora purpeofusca]|uniref:hypothetical protein n=1 Tax=Kitasatospora purpeofusca TaxID=67352 RepID=UPI00368C2A55